MRRLTLKTSSIVETLKELNRWEKKASDLEHQLTDVRTAKAELRQKLRSLELTLSAIADSQGAGTRNTSQRFDGMR